MTRRTALVWGLGLGGALLALTLAWMARQSGVEMFGGERIHLANATPAVLDTVSVRGRRVDASLGGIVAQIDTDGQVWVWAAGDAFALRFQDDPGLAVEDHVLATGRLRTRGGRRWLAVASWARVVPAVTTPPDPGL